MSFPELTIGELEAQGCVIAIQDGNHGEKHPKANDYVPEGVPFIMASDISAGYVDVGGANKLPQSITDKLRIGFCYGGDVLLSHKGSVGYVAIAPEHSPYLMLTPQVTYYRVNPERLSAEFLSYAFRDPMFQKRLLSTAGQQGTRGYVGIRAQRQLKVRFCSRSIQDRVVQAVKPYDDLIENNRRRIALLEEAARMLYREWFVYFRFPGHEHVKIMNGIPEGWERRMLGDVVEVVKDGVKPSEFADDDIHIGLEHIPRRSFTLADWEPADDLASGKIRFEPGDILFCKIRPYFHKVGFALRSGLASSDALVWRVLNENDWPLMVCATSSDHFVAVASKTVREGSKMPRADWSVLKKYVIPTPPEGLLGVFNEAIRPITAQCKNLALQNRSLAEARDVLLPRLMSGEIAV